MFRNRGGCAWRPAKDVRQSPDYRCRFPVVPKGSFFPEIPVFAKEGRVQPPALLAARSSQRAYAKRKLKRAKTIGEK
jgi:hypothetical protein